jgi:hypothetical protein
VRLDEGRWICKQCGAVLNVPAGRDPKVTIKGASGRPNVRILSIDGEEIHRCEIEHQ